MATTSIQTAVMSEQQRSYNMASAQQLYTLPPGQYSAAEMHQTYSMPPTQLTASIGMGEQTYGVAQGYSKTMVGDTELYEPSGCEFVAPGRSLRAGMTPLYNMEQVRTYEAPPMFTATRQVEPSSSSSSSEGKQRTKILLSKPPAKKNRQCC